MKLLSISFLSPDPAVLMHDATFTFELVPGLITKMFLFLPAFPFSPITLQGKKETFFVTTFSRVASSVLFLPF